MKILYKITVQCTSYYLGKNENEAISKHSAEIKRIMDNIPEIVNIAVEEPGNIKVFEITSRFNYTVEAKDLDDAVMQCFDIAKRIDAIFTIKDIKVC